MKKVLIIAYSFPPVGGAGVQRPVKFVKYLRNFGWEPIVLTVANPSVPVIDETLLKDIPLGTKIYNAKTLEPSYKQKQLVAKPSGRGAGVKSWIKQLALTLLIPDVQVLWWPGLIKTLSTAIRTEKPDCLFVTAPPFSSFLSVVLMGKLFGIPVVLDYRDEWSFSRDNWENAVKTSIARKIDSWMEGYVVRNAQLITVASPYYERTLKKRFIKVANKIHTITNGYDPEDFAGVDFFSAPERPDGRFTLLYTGTVWRATSFKGLLGGVRLLAANYPDKAARLNLRILGRIVQEEFDTIEQLKTLIHVETRDYVPHEEIFQELASADGLLLTLADLPGADKIIPGKVFEYLATPLPIMAIVPEGVTKAIVKDETSVLIAQPSEPKQIYDSLIELLEKSQTKELRLEIQKYSRPFLTEKLVLMLKNL